MNRYDEEKRRKYRYLKEISEFGRTRILIECPFCQTRFWAFVWSLCGSGKKCDNCGALHTGAGMARPVGNIQA